MEDSFISLPRAETRDSQNSFRSPDRNDRFSFNHSSQHSSSESRPYISLDPLVSIPYPPWVPQRRKYSRDILKMLTQEIEDFVLYLEPTTAEHNLRTLVVKRVEKAAKQLWPTAEVFSFGSFETQSYLPTSDVDIMVAYPCQTIKGLQDLATSLQRNQFVSKIEVLTSARVPIIKFVDSLSNYKVDVSFNVENGIDGAKIMNQFLNDESFGFSLKALLMVVKQFVFHRGFNEVYSGGLGSYSILLMVANFLRMHPLIQADEIDPEENLGLLFIEFLELYGKNLNIEKVGIAVDLKDGSSYYDKREELFYEGRKPFLLSIKDPLDKMNDVSRGSFCINEIRREFRVAYDRLLLIINTYNHQFDEYEHKWRNNGPSLPSSILGYILWMTKSSTAHREFISEVWEQIANSEIDPLVGSGQVVEGKFSSKVPIIERKRKRTGESAVDYDSVFVEGTDDEEEVVKQPASRVVKAFEKRTVTVVSSSQKIVEEGEMLLNIRRSSKEETTYTTERKYERTVSPVRSSSESFKKNNYSFKGSVVKGSSSKNDSQKYRNGNGNQSKKNNANDSKVIKKNNEKPYNKNISTSKAPPKSHVNKNSSSSTNKLSSNSNFNKNSSTSNNKASSSSKSNKNSTGNNVNSNTNNDNRSNGQKTNGSNSQLRKDDYYENGNSPSTKVKNKRQKKTVDADEDGDIFTNYYGKMGNGGSSSSRVDNSYNDYPSLSPNEKRIYGRR